MASGITCKFGGTSLADASCMRKVAAIIQADPERRFIVPSAPGKRTPDDKKITDLLYAWHEIAHRGLDPSEPRRMIAARFTELARELGVSIDIGGLLDEVAEALEREVSAAQNGTPPAPNFMASRGEYLSGRVLAEFLGAAFVDPQHFIRFTGRGLLDPNSYALLGGQLVGPGLFVVPGFYGSAPDGSVKTFSRGGSDITGAIVARASASRLYENWTDVSGFLMADPRIVQNPRPIEEITYQELRELSYMGATVLHDEAIFPVREPGIPINIRNTNAPEHPGTRIVAQRTPTRPVCGIAGRAGFTMINIEKAFMNKEHGFGLRVLTVLDEFGVAWEHMPTGIDTISLIVRDEELKNAGPELLERLRERCKPDMLELESGLAMIATVGVGMHHHVGIAATACGALADAKINVRVLDQGSSEMNIIIGVDAADLAPAVRALYAAFAQ